MWIVAHLTFAAGCKSDQRAGPQRIDAVKAKATWSLYNEEGKFMMKLLAVCCIAVFAGFAVQTSAQENRRSSWSKPFRCPGSQGASITWAWIWRRSACLW